MADNFNKQNFMQRWAATLYAREKIELIHYCQGQALIPVQKVCFQCRQLMRLEKGKGSADGWRWYA